MFEFLTNSYLALNFSFSFFFIQGRHEASGTGIVGRYPSIFLAANIFLWFTCKYKKLYRHELAPFLRACKKCSKNFAPPPTLTRTMLHVRAWRSPLCVSISCLQIIAIGLSFLLSTLSFKEEILITKQYHIVIKQR